MPPQRPMHVPPGHGRSLQLGGLGVVYKIGADVTGGAFSVVEHPIAPGILLFPHAHTYEDEYSYVLEGTIGARVGEDVVQAGAGSVVVKPRGIPHTSWNAGTTTARVMDIVSPAGFEKYFEELVAIFEAGVPPDMHKVAALIDRYGLTPRLDWVPNLEETYGVALNTPTHDAQQPE